ncbi:hypothetical protein ACFWB2_32885 [Streptomyces virginiae]|uniref:hypothetical protein n=1 Tax=Streptomyces virginiae TaxID=1961 RepID=UPI003694D432
MPHPDDGSSSSEAVRAQAGQARLEAVRDIDALIGELRAARWRLSRSPQETAQVHAQLHAAATQASLWLDQVGCTPAGSGEDAGTVSPTPGN